MKMSCQLLGIELRTLGLDHHYSVTALQWAGVCTCVVCCYGYGFSQGIRSIAVSAVTSPLRVSIVTPRSSSSGPSFFFQCAS